VVRCGQADRLYCVEFNPDLVKEARKFLAMNANGHKVDVLHADAFDYLPPEPVDVVIWGGGGGAPIRTQAQELTSSDSRFLQRVSFKFQLDDKVVRIVPFECHFAAVCLHHLFDNRQAEAAAAAVVAAR
jgi:hypothetical protein